MKLFTGLVGSAAAASLVIPASRLQAQPANNDCSGATHVGNGSFAFTTVGATLDYTGSCGQGNSNPDVWFKYLAPTTGFAKVRPAPDAPQDIGVTVLEGSCSGVEVACDSDFMWEGDTRQVVFPTVAGMHYLIRLQGVSAANASGHVVFSTATPPANDDCISAAPITGVGTFPFDNTLANNSGPDDGLACDGIGGMGIAHDVWFRWTSTLPAGQDAVVATCGGTRVDTKIAVYADGCPPGQPLDCNDDFCFNQSQVAFTPTPGAAYLIRIGNWPGFGGAEPGPDGKPGTFTVSARPTCTLSPPAGSIIEPEACGQSLNDGWDSACGNGMFTDLPASNVTIFGHAPVFSTGPDQDQYRMTFSQPMHVAFSGTAEFPMILAILDTQCPQNLQVGWRFPSQPCDDPALNPLDIVLQAGTYAFAVANGRAFSDCSAKNAYIVSIAVEPCVAPSITAQPTPQVACRGSASFTVGAAGTELFYQWQLNGSAVFDDPPHITGASDSTLSISGATGADLGAYSCVVFGACGQATSNEAALTSCYANCDCSVTNPILNVADFTCFLQHFASADPYANCDQSTATPVLNVADFTCFLTQYAAGCH
jgi:hypothetical protein